jgi:hypothetical protein
MTKEFTHNGHSYNVLSVENSDRFVVIRDNRTVRYTSDIRLYDLADEDVIRDKIAALFNK